ncbi:hypothetical protein Tco_0505811 [Tanacetum coccineum]
MVHDGVRSELVETTFYELWFDQVQFGLISLDPHLHVFNPLHDHNPTNVHPQSINQIKLFHAFHVANFVLDLSRIMSLMSFWLRLGKSASQNLYSFSSVLIVLAFLKELIYKVLRLVVPLLESNRFEILLDEREEGQVDLQEKLLEIL